MEEILVDNAKMSCFICDATRDPFFSAQLSHTSSTKTSFSEVIRTFVGKFHEFEILEDDLICQTCIMLLEELDELHSQSQQIERMLMTQIYRKYNVDSDDPPIYEIKEEQLQIFNLSQFCKQAEYKCVQCPFSTPNEDSIIPHWKLHKALNGQTKKPEKNKMSVKLYQCSVCSTAFSVVNLLAFHMELFHSDKIERSTLEIDRLDAIETDIVKNELNFTVDALEIDRPDENEIEVDTETLADYRDDEDDDYQDVDDNSKPEIQVDQDEYLRCPICEFCAVQANAMLSHIQDKHGRINFQTERRKCQFCDVIFREESGIIDHLMTHSEVVYNCTICGQV